MIYIYIILIIHLKIVFSIIISYHDHDHDHIISLYLNCWAPMLFDAISIYIMKYRAEHACIYEL